MALHEKAHFGIGVEIAVPALLFVWWIAQQRKASAAAVIGIGAGAAFAAIWHHAIVSGAPHRAWCSRYPLAPTGRIFLQRHPLDEIGNTPVGVRNLCGGIMLQRLDRRMCGARRIDRQRAQSQANRQGEGQTSDLALKFSDQRANNLAWGTALAPPALISRLMRLSKPLSVPGSIAAIRGSDRRGVNPRPSKM